NYHCNWYPYTWCDVFGLYCMYIFHRVEGNKIASILHAPLLAYVIAMKLRRSSFLHSATSEGERGIGISWKKSSGHLILGMLMACSHSSGRPCARLGIER